jgi:Rrf2 family protein
MKLRTRARYSLRMMMAITKLSSEGAPVGLADVARQCGVSRGYLEQLVPALKNAKLVRSQSGRGGGYALARNPEDIKVGDIIQAAIGPISVTECATEPETCLHAEFCNCRGLWALINHRINQVLNEYSLKDILHENWPKKVQQELQAVG